MNFSPQNIGLDYHPFGSTVPGRTYSSSNKYRFGFQGQEQESDIADVDGGNLAFKYRIHDARLGRFLSVDPLADNYSWNSPYAFSENRVIDGIELEGAERRTIHILDFGGETKMKVVEHKELGPLGSGILIITHKVAGTKTGLDGNEYFVFNKSATYLTPEIPGEEKLYKNEQNPIKEFSAETSQKTVNQIVNLLEIKVKNDKKRFQTIDLRDAIKAPSGNNNRILSSDGWNASLTVEGSVNALDKDGATVNVQLEIKTIVTNSIVMTGDIMEFSDIYDMKKSGRSDKTHLIVFYDNEQYNKPALTIFFNSFEDAQNFERTYLDPNTNNMQQSKDFKNEMEN